MSSEFAMFFFAIKCFLATKRLMAQAGHSKCFRRLQWQLFYALVLQTLIPITFIQGPFSVIYFTTLILDNSSEPFGHFLALSITMYLATDAFPTIFIIKQYRDTVVGVFKRFKVIQVQPKGAQQNSITSINFKNLA
ncbi:hypothetical protein CAEBREN_31411 [Caenorhabditis brenneri]|uniref:Uncharacterized protein n=1 Tax=Caenorhabditis brenneri TaxID=135651 RepID=G0NQQ9_CAEBE|nr:hypothetical protein CAEBREN_31411 [Caenorhabditis brenneri]